MAYPVRLPNLECVNTSRHANSQILLPCGEDSEDPYVVDEKLWIEAVICLTRRPFGCVNPIVVAMSNDHRIPASEDSSTATPAWLKLLIDLMPQTVEIHIKMSGILVVLAIVLILVFLR